MDYQEEIKEIFSHMKGRLKNHADMGFDPPPLPRDLLEFLDKPAVSVPGKEDAVPRNVASSEDIPPQKTVSSENTISELASLEDLRTHIGDCRRCGLYAGRTTLVFGEGDPNARLVFIGEGPGRDEDLAGRPFVGKSGQLLTKIIESGMGLTRKQVYICNVVKCRPPNNRDPEEQEVRTCLPFLIQQIRIIHPEVICVLGRVAAQALFGKGFRITADRGQWRAFEEIPTMTTFHPAYLLRNPAAKRETWEDIKQVMQKTGDGGEMSMFGKKRFWFTVLIIFAFFSFSAPSSSLSESLEKPLAFIIELEGAINPGTAMFVVRGLEKAREANATLAIIRLDTPGGLGSSMRTIIKAMLNSPIPVVVYVGPKGAGAASAGVMITEAADVAAMAKGTNIGAAHPVSTGGKDIESEMGKKVVNDMAAYAKGIAEEKGRNGEWVEKAIRESVSITADEALKKKVVDLVVENMDDLLKKLNGRKITTSAGTVTLNTAGIKEVVYRPGFRDKILQTISDPNISYILMMIGLAGLYFELAHPGAIFPGVIGGISLILAFFSFQTLPVNYAGVMLILLAIIFFIAEVKVASYGMLSVGGHHLPDPRLHHAF